jgi:hypothetical protein
MEKVSWGYETVLLGNLLTFASYYNVQPVGQMSVIKRKSHIPIILSTIRCCLVRWANN